MIKKDFEILPHMADLKIRAYGRDLKELFKNAMIGMFQSIHPAVASCHKERERIVCEFLPARREVKVSSNDTPSLLVDFLSEVLYLSDVYNEAYFDIEYTEFSKNKLDATLKGNNVEGFEEEIKAVTYHDLKLEKQEDFWTAEILFDI